MSSLFILGNGFDLAHGLPTKYLNFKEYLLGIYPDAEERCDDQFDIYDYLDMSEDEFAIQLLFSAMSKASGSDWGDFENALGSFNFSKKFPRRSKEVIENDDDHDIWSYMQAIDMISNVLICSASKWQNFF